MEFPCTSCGQCCKLVGHVLASKSPNPIIQSMIDSFPYETVDGVCIMLDDDGLCTTYDDRPVLCNIKELGNVLGYDQIEWYKKEADACNRIIDAFQLDDKYKVVLDF